MVPSDRLKGIEGFVAAADLGSFTAAAKRLNLTVSAISKTVGRLERRLDCRLFERTTRALKLTDAGAAFYTTCARVLSELADAEAGLTSHGAEPAGRLTIELPVDFGRRRVMPLILRLAQRYTALRPHASFSDRFVDLIEEGIDVAVRISATQTWADGLDRRYLGTEKVIFCAAPQLLERHGRPDNLDDLMRLGGILYGRADGSVSGWRMAGPGGVTIKTPPARMVLGNAEAQVEAVRHGLGVAQLATWLVAEDLQRGDLVEILPEFATDGLPLHLVWPKNRRVSAKVDAVLDLLTRDLRID